MIFKPEIGICISYGQNWLLWATQQIKKQMIKHNSHTWLFCTLGFVNNVYKKYFVIFNDIIPWYISNRFLYFAYFKSDFKHFS